MLRVSSILSACTCCSPFFSHSGGWVVFTSIVIETAGYRFAPLLQKNASMEAPSRVIVTASTAGLGVGSLGENATFGYSASKGMLRSWKLPVFSLMFFAFYSGCDSPYPQLGCRAWASIHPLQQHCARFLSLQDGFGAHGPARW